MQHKVTLSEVLAHCEKLGEDLAKDKPMVDLNGLVPHNDHHQTAIFVRLPYPGANLNQKVYDRINKLLTSVNRPDTIKADIFTVCGHNVMKGWQPTITYPKDAEGKEVKGGLFNPDWIITPSIGYVLQITVDLVEPEVLHKAVGKEYNPEAAMPDWAKLLKGNKDTPVLVDGNDVWEMIDEDFFDDDDE